MDADSTKDRLLETARRLFHERGYHATGIALILKEADVRSGTLYHFFESKEALLLAVLDRYVDMLMPFVMEPAFDTTDDPIERVFAVLAAYRGGLLATEFRLGCPIGNLALEVVETVPEARDKVSLNFDNWCKAIERCFDEARDRFPADTNRAALARFVLTVMEGGMMLARARREIEPYDAAVQRLRDYMQRLMVNGPADATPARPAEIVNEPVPSKPTDNFRVW